VTTLGHMTQDGQGCSVRSCGRREFCQIEIRQNLPNRPQKTARHAGPPIQV
jgi:hypothetical protein